jgi:hypothetical protein
MAGIQESVATPAEPAASFRRRIVLTTFGSLGDLHPYIAVALGLKARGHEAVLATSGYYRQKVEALGLGFRAVRPDHPDPEADTELMRRVMDRPRVIICPTISSTCSGKNQLGIITLSLLTSAPTSVCTPFPLIATGQVVGSNHLPGPTSSGCGLPTRTARISLVALPV